MKYTDPDGRFDIYSFYNATSEALKYEAELIAADATVPEPTDVVPHKWLGEAIVIGGTALTLGVTYLVIKIQEKAESKKVESNVSAKAAPATKEDNKEKEIRIMYHYTDVPPEQWSGALLPGNYITPDFYESGNVARDKLAIPKKKDGQEKNIRYRYTFIVKEGEYTAAPNSLPGNIVDEFDGKPGGGIEFQNTVRLFPKNVEAISD
ncbi:MAG: hypothetical protein J6X54_01510 [Treponema sp.]|nr:hypothetical protein [Treponema sp.]